MINGELQQKSRSRGVGTFRNDVRMPAAQYSQTQLGDGRNNLSFGEMQPPPGLLEDALWVMRMAHCVELYVSRVTGRPKPFGERRPVPTITMSAENP